MKFKIQIKKWIDDESESWELRFRRLKEHHEQETPLLVAEIERLENRLDRMGRLAAALSDRFARVWQVANQRDDEIEELTNGSSTRYFIKRLLEG